MASNSPIAITRVPRKAEASHPSHHVGSPPTSFSNPWPSFHKHSLLELLVTSQRNRDFKPVPSREHLVPVQKPDWGTGKGGLKATWIGHASFLVETSTPEGAERGVRVLFDPVFSERTSPVTWAGPKRYNPTPCTIDELPDVDLVVISHDHYDHMDSDTLLKIYKRRKGAVHFLVALGNAARLRGFGIGGEDVTELDWWEGVQVDVPLAGSITMTCTPSQHFSGRGILDHGTTLWCSWVIDAGATRNLLGTNDSSTSEKVFFAGDTGYRYLPKEAKESDMPSCPVFKEIGEAFGPFDLSLIPIGLFLPRHLMSSVHCSPEDALCLHKDLRSRRSIGMHYGTVRGGISQYFEEVTEPPRRFKEACEKDGSNWGEELGLLNIGETIVVLN
ncbi:beta-lactamase superfamily domain-containing protein [Usnea florida]